MLTSHSQENQSGDRAEAARAPDACSRGAEPPPRPAEHGSRPAAAARSFSQIRPRKHHRLRGPACLELDCRKPVIPPPSNAMTEEQASLIATRDFRPEEPVAESRARPSPAGGGGRRPAAASRHAVPSGPEGALSSTGYRRCRTDARASRAQRTPPRPPKADCALAASAHARGSRRIKRRMELVRVVKRFCHQSEAACGDTAGLTHSQPPTAPVWLTTPT